jgi:hypothetical protein
VCCEGTSGGSRDAPEVVGFRDVLNRGVEGDAVFDGFSREAFVCCKGFEVSADV